MLAPRRAVADAGPVGGTAPWRLPRLGGCGSHDAGIPAGDARADQQARRCQRVGAARPTLGLAIGSVKTEPFRMRVRRDGRRVSATVATRWRWAGRLPRAATIWENRGCVTIGKSKKDRPDRLRV